MSLTHSAKIYNRWETQTQLETICRHLPQMEGRKKRNPRPAEKQTLPRPVEIDKTCGAERSTAVSRLDTTSL